MATYVVGVQKTRLNETFLLSTLNIMALYENSAFRAGQFDLLCTGCEDNLCRG